MPVLNWIDYAMIAIIGLSLVTGLSRGLMREIVALLTLVIALTLSTFFAAPLAAYLGPGNDTASASYVTLGLSFALIFIATMVLGALIGLFMRFIVHAACLQLGDRLLGGVFGLVRGFLLDLVIIFLVQLTSFANAASWQASVTVQTFTPIAESLKEIVAPSVEKLSTAYPQVLRGNT